MKRPQCVEVRYQSLQFMDVNNGIEHSYIFFLEKVIEGVKALLTDKNIDVARGSALCLYALKVKTPEAEKIMRDTLEDANAFNRWTAAQTLALYADSDSRVVQEIVSQMMDNNEDADPIKNEQVGKFSRMNGDKDFHPAEGSPFTVSTTNTCFLHPGHISTRETIWRLSLSGPLARRRKTKLNIMARSSQSLRDYA